MITVWLVDDKTRLHMPASKWGMDVPDCLWCLGHKLVLVGAAEFPDTRSKAELRRVDALLDQIGI